LGLFREIYKHYLCLQRSNVTGYGLTSEVRFSAEKEFSLLYVVTDSVFSWYAVGAWSWCYTTSPYLDHITLNGRMIDKYWIRNYLGEWRRYLCKTISRYFWRDWGKSIGTSVRIATVPAEIWTENLLTRALSVQKSAQSYTDTAVCTMRRLTIRKTTFIE
jgi:hypothetical protein